MCPEQGRGREDGVGKGRAHTSKATTHAQAGECAASWSKGKGGGREVAPKR